MMPDIEQLRPAGSVMSAGVRCAVLALVLSCLPEPSFPVFGRLFYYV